MKTISKDKAEDLYYGAVATQEMSQHRWYTKLLVVYQDGETGELMGFYYLNPASELQEDQERFESDPVEVFPVNEEQVIRSIYRRADLA